MATPVLKQFVLKDQGSPCYHKAGKLNIIIFNLTLCPGGAGSDICMLGAHAAGHCSCVHVHIAFWNNDISNC